MRASQNAPARRFGIWTALACSFVSTIAASVSATHVDPTQPITVVVGPAPGMAPMAGVDGARRGRAHHPLPDHPKVLWRHAARGGLDFGPLAVDARGGVVYASATLQELVQLSSDGRETWRTSTGKGPAVTGTVLVGDGTRLVGTSAGDLVGVTASGGVRFVAPLSLQERNARVGILPLDDGGAAIAGGHEVEEFDDRGNVSHRTHLPERTTGLLVSTARGTVATAPSGGVYLVEAGYAKLLGTFGGDPSESGASTSDGHTLWAVVDHQRVVSVDLFAGSSQVHFAVTDQSLHGPVVFGAGGALGDTIAFTTWTGVLVSLAHGGVDVRRTPLEPRFATLITDAGKVDFTALDESPPPVTDGEGRIAFARAFGRLGVVLADGSVISVPSPTCHSPSALAPAGPKRMVVGCRDGTILMLGDDAP